MDINTITVAELRAKAKELGNIPGYSKMKKAELFDAVVSAIGDNSSVETVSSPEGAEVITLSDEIDRNLVAAGLPSVSEYKEHVVGDATLHITDEDWAEMIREEDRMKKMNRAQRRAYAKRKRIFETKKRIADLTKQLF